MRRVAVLGLGNWGTALAHHLARKGNEVLGWSVQPEVVEGINRKRRNPVALSDFELSPSFKATLNLEETFDYDYVVMVLPSRALDDVVPRLKLNPSTILVSAIKGMELKHLMTPLQFAEKYLPTPVRMAVLSGPSFARDIVAQRPSGVVAASKQEEVALAVAELFTSDCMKVYISTDPLGVELGGIVKNIVAIAAGVSDGLGLGDSARAGLITRGLAEMVRFAEAFGAHRMTLFGLSGLGDLAMTASSDLSRNRTVGIRLGQGELLPDIVKSLGSVAEGVVTAPLILELAKKHGIEMPITYHVVELVEGRDSPTNMVKALIGRPIKREFTV
ncbi:MAG: NAD(P)-dependent glycerol-3-phosphate dehydrogenase [Oligoflexia bacterium]|nr:NAD(P)-dependent glycerol-3-phosphate dehydrogenase [Oligoflexia bacterium]